MNQLQIELLKALLHYKRIRIYKWSDFGQEIPKLLDKDLIADVNPRMDNIIAKHSVYELTEKGRQVAFAYIVGTEDVNEPI